MHSRARTRYFKTDLTVLGAVALLVVVLAALTGSRGSGGPAPISASVPDASAFASGSAVPSGFLGLSLEYGAVQSYAGNDPARINPVLVQLIRNLTPGQQPVLRIGGDSTDRTWWPVPGMAQPPGVKYTLTGQWLTVTKALARALGAKLILGVNLEANSEQLAGTEATELLGGVGSSSVRALELGNEPELYGALPWYRTSSGHAVTGRPHGYDFTAFMHDFSTFAGALPRFPLAGPAINGTAWMPDIGRFTAVGHGLTMVTIHHYPLQSCSTPPSSPHYPTIDHLLSNRASTTLAGDLQPEVQAVHKRRLLIRLDEINTVSCGADRRVSSSFASALWALDALFELTRVGFDGVNIHTFPGAGYDLFTFARSGDRWRANVGPEYYGLLMFAQAAPPGARVLRIGSAGGRVKLWATRASDGRLRIVLINKDRGGGHTVKLKVPGAGATAALERLTAPASFASDGIRLGGRDLNGTESGLLSAPLQDTVKRSGSGEFLVELPAASAALLTFPLGGPG